MDKPVSTAQQTALDKKVDKVTGYGLSKNDFTDILKNKLDGIAEGAQVNSITGVKGSSEETYRTGNVSISASNIGLGNVNNTSDADKPISTAQ
nr:MAG TPA: Putative tail fiber protein [Caudoviricetes sp.]